jgi:hypothetical protein
LADQRRGGFLTQRLTILRRQASTVADGEAGKSAARAAIVMPAVFALADKVIGEPQTSLFDAFGSFALLVLVEGHRPAADPSGGVPRARVRRSRVHHARNALCSRHAWLAAGAMAVVGFATFFAGVINGYIAAASTGALLTFVLPVTLPAPNSAIPERLEGWGLAAGAAFSH